MIDLWFQSALLESGWSSNVRLSLDGGRIARIERGAAAVSTDERHGVALPGMANVHSHAFQRAMAGLTEIAGPGADNFWTWRELMYRFVDRLGPGEIEAIAAFAFAQMLETGFTRVGEFHYLHHDLDGTPYADLGELAGRIAAAAQLTGIGLTLLPVFYAHSGFRGLAPGRGQRRFVNDVDRFARLLEASRQAVHSLEGAVVGIAPHSLRAVTPDELAALLPLAQGAPIHLHIAEQVKEVEDCLAWSGRRPVEWLLDHAPVDERWCLVHATQMTATETRRLAASRAVAGLCPITEANLGDGIFPLPAFIEAGGRFGIGTDSNVSIGAAEELQMLEYAQRLSQRRRNVLARDDGHSTGHRLFQAAVAAGAQALGFAESGLAVGAPADIVSLDARHAALIAREGDALIDSWIFAGGGRLVDCVWRNGHQLVAGGRHLQRDTIEARYRAALEKILIVS